MNEKDLARINELARKSKSVGLTPQEKAEQARLRREYIASVRMNLRSQLDQIDIQEKDGTIVNLGEKYGHKNKALEKKFLKGERKLPRSRSNRPARPSAKRF